MLESGDRAPCKHGYLSCSTCAAVLERVRMERDRIWDLFPVPKEERPPGLYAVVELRVDEWLRLHFSMEGYNAHLDVSTAVEFPPRYYVSMWHQLIDQVVRKMRRDVFTLDTWLITYHRKMREADPRVLPPPPLSQDPFASPSRAPAKPLPDFLVKPPRFA